MIPPRTLLGLLVAFSALNALAASDEIVVDFEQAQVGTRLPEWVERGVTFKLAHAPVQTKAIGRVMFFPHLGSGHKGILNAMATEPIALEARFPGPVSSVTVVLWGSTGCAARLEAFNADDAIIDQVGLDVITRRAAPGDPEPLFHLKISQPGIVGVRLSGPRAGEFLAIDELRFAPAESK